MYPQYGPRAPVRHPPNLLFNLLGVLLIVGGILLSIAGFAYVIVVWQEFDPFRGDGPPVEVADGVALIFWGIIVLTIGRYFWRGARKRGLRDRFGRFLIILGYLLLGVALHVGVLSAVDLWSSRESGMAVVVRTMLLVALFGVPAAIVAAIGFKLADEKALARAEVQARVEYRRSS